MTSQYLKRMLKNLAKSLFKFQTVHSVDNSYSV